MRLIRLELAALVSLYHAVIGKCLLSDNSVVRITNRELLSSSLLILRPATDPWEAADPAESRREAPGAQSTQGTAAALVKEI